MSFKLSLKNKKLNEQPDVKKWLLECEKKINEEILDLDAVSTSIIFIPAK